jgi:outer membrane protein assembly factor BamB
MTRPTFSPTHCLSLALLASVAAMNGCNENSGLTNPFRHKEEPPPPLKGSEAIDRDAYAKIGYSLAWSSFVAFDRVGKGTVDKATVLGDLLVISDDTTATSALNTTSGSPKWALQVDDRGGRFKSFSRLNGQILATNETEVFMINAETGQLVDRQRLPHLSSTAPIVFGDLFVYGSGDLVVAHSLGIKEQAWAYRFPSPIKIDPVWTGGTTACFVSNDGNVGILDCATGTMVGFGRMYKNAGAVPAVGDGAVFIAGSDQSLWSFNLADGSRRWQVRTEVPLMATPSVYGQHVMTYVTGAGTVCVNSRTGDQEWVNKTLNGSMVAVRKGNPVFWDSATGVAKVIDAARGDVIVQVTLPNVARIVNGGSFADGDLYTISARGEVSKFVPR